MGASRKTSFIRGKRMRITRLDPAGNPVYGDGAVVSTKGFVTAGITTNVEEGEAVTATNADGDTCVSEPGLPSFTGFAAEIEFCEIDFAGFEILTGQPVVLNDDGEIVGITEETSIDLSQVAFALEIWLGADTKGAAPREGSQGEWGYVLLPYLSGGVIGDVSVENDAITFTVSNIASKNGARWGSGPHRVELVGGQPSPLRVPLSARAHRRTMLVEIAPPEVYGGAIPLLAAEGAASAEDATITTTGNSITISFGEGATPVFVDFGDGSWDYSPVGNLTHEYAGAGTYSVTITTGLDSRSESVTID